jgi:hypothetical protein
MLTQWQEELEARFSLSFVITDREYFAAMRRERGYGVNPWRTNSHFSFQIGGLSTRPTLLACETGSASYDPNRS